MVDGAFHLPYKHALAANANQETPSYPVGSFLQRYSLLLGSPNQFISPSIAYWLDFLVAISLFWNSKSGLSNAFAR